MHNIFQRDSRYFASRKPAFSRDFSTGKSIEKITQKGHALEFLTEKIISHEKFRKTIISHEKLRIFCGCIRVKNLSHQMVGNCPNSHIKKDPKDLIFSKFYFPTKVWWENNGP